LRVIERPGQSGDLRSRWQSAGHLSFPIQGTPIKVEPFN
jgi:hypothetical protein